MPPGNFVLLLGKMPARVCDGEPHHGSRSHRVLRDVLLLGKVVMPTAAPMVRMLGPTVVGSAVLALFQETVDRQFSIVQPKLEQLVG